VGYTLPTAIADIVDNAIAAKAKNVDLFFDWDGDQSTIVIADDGRGMTEFELREAMRPGCRNPLETRDSGDLGRFGLDMNAFGGVWETYAFIPTKNDWDKNGEAPFNCKMMRVASDLPVLCFTSDATILALHDGKWAVEFAP
jgi:hypothetical protein